MRVWGFTLCFLFVSNAFAGKPNFSSKIDFTFCVSELVSAAPSAALFDESMAKLTRERIFHLRRGLKDTAARFPEIGVNRDTSSLQREALGKALYLLSWLTRFEGEFADAFDQAELSHETAEFWQDRASLVFERVEISLLQRMNLSTLAMESSLRAAREKAYNALAAQGSIPGFFATWIRSHRSNADRAGSVPSNLYYLLLTQLTAAYEPLLAESGHTGAPHG